MFKHMVFAVVVSARVPCSSSPSAMLFPADPAPPKAFGSGDGDSDDGERGGGDWDDASAQLSARSSKTHLKQLLLTAPVVEAEEAPCKGCGRKASSTVSWVHILARLWRRP